MNSRRTCFLSISWHFCSICSLSLSCDDSIRTALAFNFCLFSQLNHVLGLIAIWSASLTPLWNAFVTSSKVSLWNLAFKSFIRILANIFLSSSALFWLISNNALLIVTKQKFSKSSLGSFPIMIVVFDC